MISLYEELCLLTLDQHTHRFPTSLAAGWYTLSAAILVELSIRRRIQRQRNGTIIVIDPSTTGDSILDDALELMKRSKEPQQIKHWISGLMNIDKLFHRTITQLISKGIIEERKKTYFFIPFKRYYLINPGIIELLKHKIRMTDNALRNERIAGLIGLVLSGEHAMQHLFSKQEWSELKERFKAVTASLPLPAAVTEVLYSGGGDEMTVFMLMTTAMDAS